jgi:hypothetical protein
VKFFLICLLALSGCAQWKQKDFEAGLGKPAEEVIPAVPTTAREEKLLEKFEVQPVAAADPAKVQEPAAPAKWPPVTRILPARKDPVRGARVTAKPVEAKAPPVAAVKPLPKDYPPELLEVNARAKKVWDLYRPNHHLGQKIFLDIHYLGMTVGKIMVTNNGKKMINGREVWHFHARFKSAPFYSNIYELDDTVDTYVTTNGFLSTRYSLVQRESKQDVDDLQLHDRDLHKTFWFYHQKKSDGAVKDKKIEKPIPYYSTDPFSVLFLYQGLPLRNGDVYEIPLVNKGKILILKSQVEGRETVETERGPRKAVRIHATTKYSGDTLKSGDLYFWFSDDAQRTLLRARAKIKIGSVTADAVGK